MPSRSSCEDEIIFHFKDDFLLESGCLILDLWHPKYEKIRILKSGPRFAKTRGNEDLTSDGISQFMAPTTWSESSPGLVRSWLAECSNHEQCRPRRQPQRLPLRLLDVGSAGVTSEISKETDSPPQYRVSGVRICSTSHLPSNTQYLTLSHCWEKYLKIMLSHSNMEEYTSSRGIPSDVFADPSAATFRDTILVTRSLGYRYLWIDSLCINQEDNSEKGVEIIFMHEIYRHADLNISATAATDGFGGLFQKRNPFILSPCTSSRLIGLFAFTLRLEHFNPNVLDGPANRRSWVFQERMLARRVLHFCSTQIFWECFTHQASETISAWHSGFRLTQVTQTKGELSPNNDDESLSTESAQSTWENIVDQCSTTYISYHQDRLPAISALARVMYERRPQDIREYAAGMWTADLPLPLLWRVSTSPRETLQTYVAPTRSWVSVLSQIDVRDRDSPVKQCFASVVEVSTTEDDPFGQVTDGYLELRYQLGSLNYRDQLKLFTVGRITPVTTAVIASTFPGSVRDGLPDKEYILITEGIPPIESSRSQSHSPPLEFPDTLICEWDYGIPGLGSTYHINSISLPHNRQLFLQDEHSFFLVPICEVDDDPEINALSYIEGLILQSTDGKNEYVRIGKFYYTRPWNEGRTRRDFIFGKDEELDKPGVHEKHNDGTLTVRII